MMLKVTEHLFLKICYAASIHKEKTGHERYKFILCMKIRKAGDDMQIFPQLQRLTEISAYRGVSKSFKDQVRCDVMLRHHLLPSILSRFFDNFPAKEIKKMS